MAKIKIPKPCKRCGKRMDPPFPHHGGGWYCSKPCAKKKAKAWWGRSNRPNYFSYLESAAWRERRQFILERANGKCEYCVQRADVFHVHHLTYDRLGREHPNDLMALCPPCHSATHGKSRPGKRAKEITPRIGGIPPSPAKMRLELIAANEKLHERQQSARREQAKIERKVRRRKRGEQAHREHQKRYDNRHNDLDPSSPFRYLAKN